MTVLVDTSVWSLVLRRRNTTRRTPRQRAATETMRELITEGTAALIGPIRQEILSGLHERSQFERLRDVLTNFPHILIEEIDYDRAAECFNDCRGKGVAATAIDMLICATALRVEVPVFTTDRDFVRYAKIIEVELFEFWNL